MGTSINIDTPAYVKYDGESIIEQRWYMNDKLDVICNGVSVDLPAVIKYNTAGQIIQQEWYKNGQLHRDTLNDSRELQPAYIIYTNGKIRKAKWYHNNKLVVNRIAIIEYNSYRQIVERIWFNVDRYFDRTVECFKSPIYLEWWEQYRRDADFVNKCEDYPDYYITVTFLQDGEFLARFYQYYDGIEPTF